MVASLSNNFIDPLFFSELLLPTDKFVGLPHPSQPTSPKVVGERELARFLQIAMGSASELE
jgi:hypothetical protein